METELSEDGILDEMDYTFNSSDLGYIQECINEHLENTTY